MKMAVYLNNLLIGQRQMKNYYDFEKVIGTLNNAISQNLAISEASNKILKGLDVNLLKQMTSQLKEQYLYKMETGKISGQDFEEAVQVLELICNEKTTNIEELYLQLSQEINEYYYDAEEDIPLITAKKMVPYFRKCQICQQNVSNHLAGLKLHSNQCGKEKRQHKPKKIKPSLQTQTQYMIHFTEKIKKYQNQPNHISNQDHNQSIVPSSEKQIKKKLSHNLFEKKSAKTRCEDKSIEISEKQMQQNLSTLLSVTLKKKGSVQQYLKKKKLIEQEGVSHYLNLVEGTKRNQQVQMEIEILEDIFANLEDEKKSESLFMGHRSLSDEIFEEAEEDGIGFMP